MSLIAIADDLYIDPERVEALSIINELDDHKYIQITLQNSVANVPLSNATLDQVAEKINNACAVLNL